MFTRDVWSKMSTNCFLKFFSKWRALDRGGTTRLGNSTRLESTLYSSFNSSLTRLVSQLENSQLDSTRFLISKLDNSISDSNANTLPKILNFTTYKMKHASIFFIFSHFFASSDDFLILPSTFACWKTYFQKSSRNCSKIGTRNSTRNWKIVTRIDSIENFHNWFWARLDSIPKSINSTRLDLINFQLVPPLVCR